MRQYSKSLLVTVSISNEVYIMLLTSNISKPQASVPEAGPSLVRKNDFNTPLNEPTAATVRSHLPRAGEEAPTIGGCAGRRNKSRQIARRCYLVGMKSSYELAMERLSKAAPSVKLSAAQKAEIAELESSYAAKIAGREIAMQAEIAKVAGDSEKAVELTQQLALDRKKLQAELDEKKQHVRQSGGK